MKKKTEILFICRQRLDSYGISIGLINSAKFVINSLNDMGYDATLVSAVDSNCIDRLVMQYDPTYVIIEAIWVPPAKFVELLALPRHYARKWVVRVHSKMPFLAQEGIAIQWLKGYASIDGIIIAPNSQSMTDDMVDGMGMSRIVHLPNIYEPKYDHPAESCCSLSKHKKSDINIGCFGAIRPLKNHLEQAVAAMTFSKRIGKKLRFHINGNRVEGRGEESLKNLRAMFANTEHELVEHPWMPHEAFVGLVRSMDLGLQVSFSESFNIVAADFIANDVPIIVSHDVEWASDLFMASPTSAKDISHKLYWAWMMKKVGLQCLNKMGLNSHNRKAKADWKRFLNS